jgi:hypothetical protein
MVLVSLAEALLDMLIFSSNIFCMAFEFLQIVFVVLSYVSFGSSLYSFVHIFNKYLLSTYYMLNSILGVEYNIMKIDPTFMELIFK